MEADQQVCDDTVMGAGAPLDHSVILLRQQPPRSCPAYSQLLAQAKCVASPSRAPRESCTDCGSARRRDPLAARTLQHEPGDKNKRSSNATGRREADAAAAQMRRRERAGRNSHGGRRGTGQDRKPDILLNPQ